MGLFDVIGSAIGGLVTGGPLGAVTGAIGGLTGGAKKNAPNQTPAAGGTLARKLQQQGINFAAGNNPLGQIVKTGSCPDGFVQDSSGNCVRRRGFNVDPGAILPGGRPFISGFGDAVTGQFGVALEPATREINQAVCPRGTVLGKDGLCYNKSQLRNSDRMWPRGRRPLLTGGEMRCISVAASAAKKLQRKEKQLQAMGLLKRPTRRAPSRAQPARLPPGVQVIDTG